MVHLSPGRVARRKSNYPELPVSVGIITADCGYGKRAQLKKYQIRRILTTKLRYLFCCATSLAEWMEY